MVWYGLVWYGELEAGAGSQEVEILDEELGEEEVEARDTFTSSQLGKYGSYLPTYLATYLPTAPPSFFFP